MVHTFRFDAIQTTIKFQIVRSTVFQAKYVSKYRLKKKKEEEEEEKEEGEEEEEEKEEEKEEEEEEEEEVSDVF
ncbi:hypothetical protein PoB_005587800 [Plakobranchus ocellatus]|uniref:Uncharacterized protein n=1 Tax=Plakobranchus ocellatus TaxID=259542 RepID=A0AAV4CD64_9GAST|nr:hypothetical protein PoB_005587800 [Plakobranchus ocellatus]